VSGTIKFYKDATGYSIGRTTNSPITVMHEGRIVKHMGKWFLKLNNGLLFYCRTLKEAKVKAVGVLKQTVEPSAKTDERDI
jgi:hypothetical protein